MGARYQRRAADLIQKHLSELLGTRVNDPRLHMVTITGVQVNVDTTVAHIYFSVMGDESVQADALDGLRSATGFLRRELGQRLRLRNTPELRFHYDPSFERGEHISGLLDRLKDDSGTEPE
jgi:ribosome-binding factor A